MPARYRAGVGDRSDVGELDEGDGRQGAVVAVAVRRLERVGVDLEGLVGELAGLVGEGHLDDLERAQLHAEPLAADDDPRNLLGPDRHVVALLDAAVEGRSLGRPPAIPYARPMPGPSS